jgi:hypothetical protein
MLLSAIAYNLKKLLKYQPKQVASMAIALCPGQPGLYHHLFSTWLTDSSPFIVSFLAERKPSLSSATATVVARV